MSVRISAQHSLVIIFVVVAAIMLLSRSGGDTDVSAPPLEESEVRPPKHEMAAGECQVNDDCARMHGDMECFDFEVNQTGQCTANCRWHECQNGTCMAINVIAIKNYADDLSKTFGEECTHSSFLNVWQ